MDYTPVNLSNSFSLSSNQKQTIKDIASDLQLLKKKADFIEDVVIRAGFVLDTILNANPHDIDALYTTKEQVGKTFKTCRCNEINELITDENFTLFNNKYSLDLGHFFEGEPYVNLIEKAVGFNSHLMDIPDMVCINSKGEIWGNKESEYCIKDRIHEIRFDGWLILCSNSKEFPFNNFNYFYIQTIFRGLKMIISKNYTGVGNNYLNLINNCVPYLQLGLENKQYTEALIKYKNKKADFMDITNIEKSLSVTKCANSKEVLTLLKNILSL